MICPSGLLSGSDIFSTSSAMMRFTAMSSGASTSRTLLPKRRTRERGSCSCLRPPASLDQRDHQLRVLAVGGLVRHFVDLLSHLDGEMGVVAQHGVDAVVVDVLHAAEQRGLAIDHP